MTMIPAQSLSKVKHQHQQQQQQQQQEQQQRRRRRRRQRGEEWHGGGYYGGCAETFGLMINHRLEEGYDHYCYNNNNCVSTTEANSLEYYSDLDNDVANCNPMAEDESRTNSSLNNDAAGSSSKDVQDEKDEANWLQLSIGGALTTRSHDHHHHDRREEDPPTTTSARRGGGLIELDLLPAGSRSSSNNQASRLLPSSGSPFFHIAHHHEFRAHHPRPMNIHGAATFGTSLFFQHHPALGSSSSSTYPPPAPPHQEFSWGAFRPTSTMSVPQPYNIAAALSSSSSFSASTTSSSALMPLGSYFSRPLHQVHSGLIDVPGPSSDLRVIDPPRRPHAGIWFMLQASQNQSKEPFLPQVSKSYLRIKDGRMTVRLIMKYLVNKLKLDSESEQVEITCRGQQLLPFLTLQHVRDNIWSPGDEVTLLPDSSTTDHVMVLHYARSA